MVKKALLAGILLFSPLLALAAEYWIDVRIPEQYQETHVQDAVNIPLKELAQRISEVTQNKDDTLHLYCNSGNQSGKAQKLLQEMGYKNAVNEGGLKEVEKTQTLVKK